MRGGVRWGEHLGHGLTFGSQVAGWFAVWRAASGRPVPGSAVDVPGFAVDMLAGDEAVSAGRGYLALVYTQAAALSRLRPGGRGGVTGPPAAAPPAPPGPAPAGPVGSAPGLLWAPTP